MPPESAKAAANPAADAAIRRALEHLKTTQKQSGAWDGGFGEATSITSLAVMAYLAAGHVPGAPGPYRDTVERGVRYVLEHQHADGMLVSNNRGGPMYCHGISTLMLAEVVGMIPDPALAERVQKALSRAVDVIVKSQDVKKGTEHAGGWRYQPNSNDSDISVTGWQVMALRAAKSAGCAVDSTRIDRAVRYLKRCAVKDGGFAYQPRQGPNNPRTGVGILALEICGTHLTPEAVAGSKYLLKHPPQWGSAYFFYEAYYCSQAMFQIGEEASRGLSEKARVDPPRAPATRRELALRRRQRPVRRPQLLHRHGRAGPGRRVWLPADLSALKATMDRDLIPKKSCQSANILRESCVCLGVSGAWIDELAIVQNASDRDHKTQ